MSLAAVSERRIGGIMFYGLHFTSDAGVVFQVAVNSANCHIFCRATKNGAWSPWRRVDVERNNDGTLNERVAEAVHAQRADAAMRWLYTMKLSFEGDARGEVSFDGSQNVTCRLNVAALGDLGGRIDNLSERIDKLEHSKNDQNGYD